MALTSGRFRRWVNTMPNSHLTLFCCVWEPPVSFGLEFSASHELTQHWFLSFSSYLWNLLFPSLACLDLQDSSDIWIRKFYHLMHAVFLHPCCHRSQLYWTSEFAFNTCFPCWCPWQRDMDHLPLPALWTMALVWMPTSDRTPAFFPWKLCAFRTVIGFQM